MSTEQPISLSSDDNADVIVPPLAKVRVEFERALSLTCILSDIDAGVDNFLNDNNNDNKTHHFDMGSIFACFRA